MSNILNFFFEKNLNVILFTLQKFNFTGRFTYKILQLEFREKINFKTQAYAPLELDTFH